jgi:pimeloyl-ACP methyl ester carboxylesterase
MILRRSVHKQTFRDVRQLLLFLALMGLFLAYVLMPVVRAGLVAHPKRKPVLASPADLDLESEDVTFMTADKLALRGWYIPSQNGAAVIIAHGYGGNRGDYLEPAAMLAEQGYGVLLIDLLGYGQSEGDKLALDGGDVIAALAYLQGLDEIGPGCIGAWGFSLGGLASIQAAAQTETLQAVVADGPFPVVSSKDMPPPTTLEDWLWIPFDWTQFYALKLQGISGFVETREALARIAPRPVLLIAGAQNRGELRVMREYAASGSTVALWEIEEAGHVGGWGARTEEYAGRVTEFFDQALLGKESPR